MSLCSLPEATNIIDSCIPIAIWNQLTKEDQIDYIHHRVQFHKQQRSSVGKDSRVASFHKELLAARSYIERREGGKEERSIVCGVCFAGKYICINTRLLKSFLGRCKSSINGSLQQMGYVALRTKTKARNCVLAVMHSLVGDVNNLRQWSVRCASEGAEFTIESSFPDAKLPEINESDLTAWDSHNSEQSHEHKSTPKIQNPLKSKPQTLNDLLSQYTLNISAIQQFNRINQLDLNSLLHQNTFSNTINTLPHFDDPNWDGGISSLEPVELLPELDVPSTHDKMLCFLDIPNISIDDNVMFPTSFF